MGTCRQTYLVTGGSRSGKSRYALELAKNAERPYYIATGWAGDVEMSDRIKKHQAERGPHWTTTETRTDITKAISEAVEKGSDFIIVDCLTLWTSNVLFEKKDEFEKLIAALTEIISRIETPIVFVTNEVGSGIVPADKMTREFRDLAGIVNQRVAAAVNHVYLAVSGISIKIK